MAGTFFTVPAFVSRIDISDIKFLFPDKCTKGLPTTSYTVKTASWHVPGTLLKPGWNVFAAFDCPRCYTTFSTSGLQQFFLTHDFHIKGSSRKLGPLDTSTDFQNIFEQVRRRSPRNNDRLYLSKITKGMIGSSSHSCSNLICFLSEAHQIY